MRAFAFLLLLPLATVRPGLAGEAATADDGSALVDPGLRDRAELVLRARIVQNEGGSKYWWLDVEPLSVVKAPADFDPPKKLNIACLSIGQGLPLGTATIYLVRYNPDHAEYGWKLLEEWDISQPYTGKIPDPRIAKGYSHFSE